MSTCQAITAKGKICGAKTGNPCGLHKKVSPKIPSKVKICSYHREKCIQPTLGKFKFCDQHLCLAQDEERPGQRCFIVSTLG